MDSITVLTAWQHQLALFGSFPEGLGMCALGGYGFIVRHISFLFLVLNDIQNSHCSCKFGNRTIA